MNRPYWLVRRTKRRIVHYLTEKNTWTRIKEQAHRFYRFVDASAIRYSVDGLSLEMCYDTPRETFGSSSTVSRSAGGHSYTCVSCGDAFESDEPDILLPMCEGCN